MDSEQQNGRVGEADPAFRAEVTRFVEENLPPDIARKVDINAPLDKDDFTRWHRILYQRGWAAPAWPVEYGGTGWSLAQRFAFEEISAGLSAPRLPQFGLGMLGPILIARGTDAQRRRYLPKILSSEEWWCQGYSEPGAGSDLAALRTRAVREGDHYLVTGGKIWTSYAHYADRMFALVRTDATGSKQQGITFLLLDMRAPGVTVRPITGINGQHVVNEVFLDNVAVPVEDRVGEEGEGWAVAKALLGHERTGIARVGFCKKQFALLSRLAARPDIEGRTLLEDPAFAQRMADQPAGARHGGERARRRLGGLGAEGRGDRDPAAHHRDAVRGCGPRGHRTRRHRGRGRRRRCRLRLVLLPRLAQGLDLRRLE
jgi:alkylation response protein AidB-like acyl-CoA dehydrogenase